MEIGLDYMQIRTQAQHYGLRWAGFGLLITGIILVIVGLAYYGNLYWLKSSVDKYEAKRGDLAQLPSREAPPAPESGRIVSTLALPPGTYDDSAGQLGFTPLGASDAHPLGTLPPAQRLIVPELGINVKMSGASLTGASILNTGKGQDPTQVDVVQANPGERGALWFFGEAGKGASNFGGLRDAPALLDDGDDILIFVDNGSEVYLYAATHTDVIASDELHLSGSDRSTIHLTVPVPPGLFDHFLVLSGELVGVK